MCNLAGYAGNRQAAPILLEMLRKQQACNGGKSTGIATIHEGKIHMRKVVGNVDDLIRNTDALELPGTIGIAHSRPSGKPGLEEYAQPFLSMDDDSVLMTNGIQPAFCPYIGDWNKAVDLLVDNGYVFRTETENPKGESPKRANGRFVNPPEVRVNLISYYLMQGKTPAEALAASCTHMYSDNVSVMMNLSQPDTIFACRTTRPMNVLIGEGETLLSTTPLAFPDNVPGEAYPLPLMYVCAVSAKGMTITADRIDRDTPSAVTPLVQQKALPRVCALLQGKKDAPVLFDTIEIAIREEMKDIWPEQRYFQQEARLAYDILRQLKDEGRLKQATLIYNHPQGPVEREFFWLED